MQCHHRIGLEPGPELELSLPLPVEYAGELNILPPDNEFDDDERLTVFSFLLVSYLYLELELEI